MEPREKAMHARRLQLISLPDPLTALLLRYNLSRVSPV
jgi:hypothetical protein